MKYGYFDDDNAEYVITRPDTPVNLASADVNLEAAHTRQRTLRGADVCGIVWECRDAVTNGGTDRREDVSGQLHTVAGVTREADHNLIQLLHF